VGFTPLWGCSNVFRSHRKTLATPGKRHSARPVRGGCVPSDYESRRGLSSSVVPGWARTTNLSVNSRKTEGVLLQPLRWCCVKCVIHHVKKNTIHMCVKNNTIHICGANKAIKEWSWRGSSADINLWTIERND